MAPIPDDKQTHPAHDPAHDCDDDLETPAHIIPPAPASSSDDEDDEGDDSVYNGYTLLPQEEGEEEGGGDPLAQDYPPAWGLDAGALPAESLTEVRGAGLDVTKAVADGSVHPAFAARFPDNKVPVHLQIPASPKGKSEDVLWNQSPQSDRIRLDSDQLCQVKRAMAGFKLPTSSIPGWAQDIPEDQWQQRLAERLAVPAHKSAKSGAAQAKSTASRPSAQSAADTDSAAQDSKTSPCEEGQAELDSGQAECSTPNT